MQFSDNNACSMPANWPKNELIGDKVIIPAASTVEAANERLAKIKKGEIEGYDWWFSYRDAKAKQVKKQVNPSKATTKSRKK
jgi:peroxiredoxin (alkyl hydroperoxide reductase subunit C)